MIPKAILAAGVLAATNAGNPISIELTSPTDGSVISGTVTLSSIPVSSAAPIVKVEYYMDGVSIATATNPISPPANLNLQSQ